MDVNLVAEHVRRGHLAIEDLPKDKRGKVEAIVKKLGPVVPDKVKK